MHNISLCWSFSPARRGRCCPSGMSHGFLKEASTGRIEVVLDVDLESPAAPHAHHLLPQGVEGVVRGAPWAEAIGAVKKILLVDGVKHHGDRPLEHLIFEGGNPDRAQGCACAFRDIHAPYRWGNVSARLETREQRLQVRWEVRCRGLGRLAIDPDRAIFPGTAKRFVQEGPIDVMGERGEDPLRSFSGQCCYPLEFRGDGCRTRCSCHLSLQKVCVPVPPFLHRVAWDGFPCFAGTLGHSDVSRSLPCPSRVLAARYLRWGLQFAPQCGAPLAVLWPGPWSPVDPPGMCRRRWETSQVPGEPLYMRAPLCDPGGLGRPCLGTDDSMLPSGFSTPSAPREPYFRGSITRPTYALSTLRSAGHPAAAQDSLPGCWLGVAWAGLTPAGLRSRISRRWCVCPPFLSSQASLAHGKCTVRACII